MAENYTAALKAVIQSLQGFCKIDDNDSRKKCKREIYERAVIEELSRTTDKDWISWKENSLAKAKECYEYCRVWGKDEVKICNTTCLNPIVQGIWKGTNLTEYKHIISKYGEV